jgi:hypothetical protein
MYVAYKYSHRYTCQNLDTTVLGESCASLNGPSLDEAVARAFLEALQPAQLDTLDAVLKQQAEEGTKLDKHWQEQLRRTEYEAKLAQRQYDAVDPENRLVAAELEHRWEEKLQALRQAQEQYTRFQKRPPVPALSAEQREQFRHLSETLPALWQSGALTPEQQKELLRCLISRVIVKRIATDQVEARVVWASGHYMILLTRPPIYCTRDVSGYERMVERIHQLWQEKIVNDDEIAAQLTAEGFRSARSESVRSTTVMKIRLKNGWYSVYHQSRGASTARGYLTVTGLAAKLEVSRDWVYGRLASGVIDSAYVLRRSEGEGMLIKDDPELIAALQSLKKDKRLPKGK